MRRTRLHQAQSVYELLRRRLENAEQKLRAGLLRLAALDLEIARRCVERAQGANDADDLALSFATIESRRRASMAKIEELRKERVAAEFRCDELRGETRRLLRRKIAVESAIAAMDEDARKSSARR